MSDEPLKAYKVWDAPTRWFHWINVATILVSAFFGFLIMYMRELNIQGAEPKITLKVIHTLVSYVLVCSLLGRFVWGFAGNRYVRWRAVLPNRQTFQTIGSDMRSLVQGRPINYLGRGQYRRRSNSIARPTSQPRTCPATRPRPRRPPPVMRRRPRRWN